MIGQQVSQFRVQSLIGRGGMGEVYLADDLSLNRRVALKFLTGAGSDVEAAGRLLREARAIAGLDHPFLCKVYAIGETDGRPYLAMEYINGQTLQQRLEGGPISVADAVRIAREIAEAMECVHGKGIVHRDLKPSNVMIATDGHVKVMDFGIATRVPLAGIAESTTRLTMAVGEPGVIAGTLAYSSPEQLRGLPLDARSDVFAFGILLHEMLTGTHPFERQSPIDTATAVLNAPAATLGGPGGQVPSPLARIVSRCLEKERDRRFGAFQDIRLELESLSESSGAASRPRPSASRLAIAGAGVVIAVAVAAAIWFEPGWLHLSERALAFNARDWIIIADCENLTGEPVFDRSINLALEVGIGQSNYVNVYSRDRVQSALQRIRRPSNASIDLALASDIAQRDNVRAVLTCALSRIGKTYSVAARIVDPRMQRIAATESAVADDRDHVMAALDQLVGRLRRRLGESLATLSTQNVALPQATTSSLEALKLFTDSQRVDDRKGPDTSDRLLEQAIVLDPDFAMAHALLGHSYLLASETPTRRVGEEHIRKALSLRNRLTTRERLLIGAAADDAHGERELAVAGYRSYLAQYPDDVGVWFRLGWTYMAGLHQSQNAIEAFERVLAIDPKNTGAILNLATCYGGLGQYERAAATYEKAFAIQPDELLGQYVNNEYGAVLMHLGRLADAETAFTKMASQQVRRARGLRSLAFLSMFRGHYGDALRMLHEAIALNQAADANVSVYRDRMIVIRALLAKGKKEEAQRELTQVNALIARVDFGPEWLASLVAVQSRLGNIREGERLVVLISRSVGDVVAGASANRSASGEAGFVDLARAELLAAQHKPDEADTAAAAATARLGNDALATAAHVAAAARHDDDAVARYTRLIDHPVYINEAQEDWFEAHVALGAVYERTGRSQDAKRLYERVAELWKDGDPDLVALRTARARLATLSR